MPDRFSCATAPGRGDCRSRAGSCSQSEFPSGLHFALDRELGGGDTTEKADQYADAALRLSPHDFLALYILERRVTDYSTSRVTKRRLSFSNARLPCIRRPRRPISAGGLPRALRRRCGGKQCAASVISNRRSTSPEREPIQGAAGERLLTGLYGLRSCARRGCRRSESRARLFSQRSDCQPSSMGPVIASAAKRSRGTSGALRSPGRRAASRLAMTERPLSFEASDRALLGSYTADRLRAQNTRSGRPGHRARPR